jgi:hypothetical protein
MLRFTIPTPAQAEKPHEATPLRALKNNLAFSFYSFSPK